MQAAISKPQQVPQPTDIRCTRTALRQAPFLLSRSTSGHPLSMAERRPDIFHAGQDLHHGQDRLLLPRGPPSKCLLVLLALHCSVAACSTCE